MLIGSHLVCGCHCLFLALKCRSGEETDGASAGTPRFPLRNADLAPAAAAGSTGAAACPWALTVGKQCGLGVEHISFCLGPLFKFRLLIFKIEVTLSWFSSLLEGGVVE